MCIFYEVITNITKVEYNNCKLKYEGSIQLTIEKNVFFVPIKGTAYSEYIEIFTSESGSILNYTYQKNEELNELIHRLNLPFGQDNNIYNKIENSVQYNINTYIS